MGPGPGPVEAGGEALITLQGVASALSELVAVPSVNPHLCPAPARSGADEPGGTETDSIPSGPALTGSDALTGEAAIADALVGWCAARGIEAWLEEAAPERPNVVARVGAGAPVLILCAHTDTVDVAGMTIEPFTPRVEDGRLYGRGAFDMKAGVAAILCALEAIAADPVEGTVMAAFVADEEWASAGAYDFVHRHGGDACIVTEPSDGKLVLAHKGFVWLEIMVRGTAAHGSRWDLGDSAIARAARIITALDEFDRGVLRQRTYPLLGPASLHASTISGGSGISTYAAECVIGVERRTLPEETPDQVVAEVQRVIAAAGESADLRITLDRPPLVCDRDALIARTVRAACVDVTGAEPEECGVAYWMDAAVFAHAGIPTVNIGAAGGGAHAAEEWVELASVVENARILEAAARRFCR